MGRCQADKCPVNFDDKPQAFFTEKGLGVVCFKETNRFRGFDGALMIKSIQANLPEDASVSQIATLYNNINATTVNDYGARVAAVYKSQPWK